MKFATRLKVTATVAGGVISTLTLGSAAAKARTLQQAIDAGNSAGDTTAIKVSDTGVPFMVENETTGDWEEAKYTITSGTVITKESVIASSNGGAAVSFPAGAVSVYSTLTGAWARSVVTTSDGVALTDLTSSTPTGTSADTYVMMMVDPATGTPYKVTVAALKTLFGSAPTETLTVNNPGAQVAGTSFTVTGTYANGTPTAMDWSINGGSSWNAAASPTISGGTYSFAGVSVPSANASQTVMVRDHNAISIMGTSASFVVSAAYAITVNTPGTQTVGTPFNVTGGYTNGTPTALDYRLSDDPAGQWTQVASATISLGSFQFSLTPSTTSAGRTISVRDRNNTSVSSTSGMYAVISASATVTSVTVSPSAPTVSGGQTQQFTATVAGTNSPSQAVTWSKVSGVGSINATTGLYTAPAATGSAQTAVIQALSTQDGTTVGQATITIPAATATITVDTPSSPKVVGTAFAVTGNWTITQPTALDYRLSDDAAGVWTQVTATINANGTYTFNITPASTSAGRTISVRDRNNTSVSGTSGSYSVNAAATLAQTMKLTATNSSSLTAGTGNFSTSNAPEYSVTGPTSQNVRVNVRDAAGNSILPSRVKFVYGVYGQPCPVTTFSTAGMPAGVNGTSVIHSNGFTSGTAVGSWGISDTASAYYGSMAPNGAFYAWVGTGAGGLSSTASGTTIDMQLWLVFDDNSYKAYDNVNAVGQGTPVKFTFAIP